MVGTLTISDYAIIYRTDIIVALRLLLGCSGKPRAKIFTMYIIILCFLLGTELHIKEFMKMKMPHIKYS